MQLNKKKSKIIKVIKCCVDSILGESPSVLPEVQKLMKGLSEEVHRFAFDIVFAQLKEHLNNLANMEVSVSFGYTQQTKVWVCLVFYVAYNSLGHITSRQKPGTGKKFLLFLQIVPRGLSVAGGP